MIITFELWNEISVLNPYSDYNKLNRTIVLDNNSITLKNLFENIILNSYCFHDLFQERIDKKVELLKLPDRYIGMHIRCGDKITENRVYHFDRYFQLLQKKNKQKLGAVFVFTDDYTIIENVCNIYPNYKFYSICEKNERGYVNSDFNLLNSAAKSEKMLNLFASIEILRKSELFVGVYNSSPDMFIDLVRNKNTYFVDREL